MNKLNSTFLVLFSALVVCTSLHAQKETVILYNSQPVKVELSEKGSIQSFIGLMPGYMAGYDLTPAINIPSNENAIDLADVEQKGYDIISINRIQLNYKPNFAILDKAVIDQLNAIAAKMKTSPEQRLLLTAHTTDQKQSRLSKNRLASAIAYLGLKGISSDRIKTETQQSTTLLNVIAVAYLQ